MDSAETMWNYETLTAESIMRKKEDGTIGDDPNHHHYNIGTP